MGLQVWLPLNGNLNNQGLSNVTVTNNGATVDNNGKIGKCYSFNGSSNYISISPIGSDFTDLSISLWLDLTNISGVQYFIGTNDGRGIRYSSNDSSFLIYTSNASSGSVFPFTKINSFVHVAITKAGTIWTVYINGQQIGTINITGSLNIDKIGRRTDGYYYKGKINDFRIYDNCLSAKEVKLLSQGLILHYPLDRNGWGQENYILDSDKVTSGGNASGITRTYETDGSMKIVAASGNGSWASLGFARNSNTLVGENFSVGDTYTISCDVKITSGSKLPTLFINSGNGYKQLKGPIILNQWIRAYYTSTWAEPGTSYGNISLHLGFSNAIGTYYFKNFKLEKGNKPTTWTPNSTDDFYSTMGIGSSVECDVSGYQYNGTRTGTYTWSSNSYKYNVSTYFEDYTRYISCLINNDLVPTAVTMSCWIKSTNTSPKGGYHIPLNMHSTNFEISIPSNGKARMGYVVGGTRYVSDVGSGLLDGNWHMLTSTFNGSTICRYIDGVLINSENRTGALTALQTLGVGNFPGSTTYGNTQVYESDVRIYVTALSADDILELYNNKVI